MIWNFPIPLYLWIAAAAILATSLVMRLQVSRLSSRISWIVVAALFIGGMLLIPSQNHLLGDGLTHLDNPGRTISTTEPLDILVHHLVYSITGSALWSYRLVAFVCGLLYLLGVTLLLMRLSNRLEQAIVALAFLATGTLQFYFGYVESYTLLHLCTLYFILFGWRDLGRKKISLLPLLFFGVALVSHFSAISLLPAVVFLYRRRLGRGIWWLVGGVLLAGFAVGMSANISMILVPFWPTDFSAYSLLAPEHLRDLLNILLISGPAFFLTFWRGELDRRQQFTLFALAGTLGFAILVDPKIGVIRDWDLLSVFAVPLVALVALRAPRHGATVAVLAIVIVLRVVPWLLFNSQPQNEFVKTQVNADLHYSAKYDEGQRLESWGLLLQRIGDDPGAEQAWLKRLEIEPRDDNTLNNLSLLQFGDKKYAESYKHYLVLLDAYPRSDTLIYKTAYSAFAAGQLDDAMNLLNKLSKISQDNPEVLTLYAGILSRSGYHQQAIDVVQSTQLVALEVKLVLNLARSAREVGRRDIARALIKSAHKKDSTDQEVTALYDSLRN
jgi:Flp pilus assembly protein TadD